MIILNGNNCCNVLIIILLWNFLSEEALAQSLRVDEYIFTYLRDYPLLNYDDAISACKDDFQRDIFFVRREGITQQLVEWLVDFDKIEDEFDATGMSSSTDATGIGFH